MKVGAKLGTVKVSALLRDKNGNPKIDDDKLIQFWQYLSDEEKELLKERYDNISKHPK